MSLALHRENYFWHKVHSLTGVVPVGFYMLQHLTLNSFTLGGPAKFDAVIHFFESVPKHLLIGLEIFVILLPLLFHAIYGVFIIGRGESNYFTKKYGWSQNRMYMLQRWSGIVLFFFLIYHVLSTTGLKYLKNDASVIMFDAWASKLSANGYIVLVVYMIGVVCASYHLAYGIWNFCIRWGITISDQAQTRMQKFSLGLFVVITLLGWGALAGFLIPRGSGPVQAMDQPSSFVSLR